MSITEYCAGSEIFRRLKSAPTRGKRYMEIKGLNITLRHWRNFQTNVNLEFKTSQER